MLITAVVWWRKRRTVGGSAVYRSGDIFFATQPTQVFSAQPVYSNIIVLICVTLCALSITEGSKRIFLWGGGEAWFPRLRLSLREYGTNVGIPFSSHQFKKFGSLGLAGICRTTPSLACVLLYWQWARWIVCFSGSNCSFCSLFSLWQIHMMTSTVRW